MSSSEGTTSRIELSRRPWLAAVEHGLRLTALRPVVPSLDDIYRRAVHARGLAVESGAAA